MSKKSLSNLLLDEVEEEDTAPPKTKKRKTASSHPSTSANKNKTATLLYNLFGSDSEDESLEQSRPRASTLPAVFCRRVANGVTKQTSTSKGDFYIDLKVYSTAEVERVSGEDRWQHALLSVKTRIQHTGAEWGLLQRFVTQLRESFQDAAPVLIPSRNVK